VVVYGKRARPNARSPSIVNEKHQPPSSGSTYKCCGNSTKALTDPRKISNGNDTATSIALSPIAKTTCSDAMPSVLAISNRNLYIKNVMIKALRISTPNDGVGHSIPIYLRTDHRKSSLKKTETRVGRLPDVHALIARMASRQRVQKFSSHGVHEKPISLFAKELANDLVYCVLRSLELQMWTLLFACKHIDMRPTSRIELNAESHSSIRRRHSNGSSGIRCPNEGCWAKATNDEQQNTIAARTKIFIRPLPSARACTYCAANKDSVVRALNLSPMSFFF
jgi:hypothetical protein